MINLEKAIITCIHKENTTFMNRKEELEYHMEYFMELAKKDKIVNEAMREFGGHKGLTIMEALVKQGTCLIMNTAIENKENPNKICIYMPEAKGLTDYQRNILENIKEDRRNANIEILSLGEFNKGKNEPDEKITADDAFKPNMYMLDSYIEKKNITKR